MARCYLVESIYIYIYYIDIYIYYIDIDIDIVYPHLVPFGSFEHSPRSFLEYSTTKAIWRSNSPPSIYGSSPNHFLSNIPIGDIFSHHLREVDAS